MKQIIIKVPEQWLCDNSDVKLEDYEKETSRSVRARMVKKGEDKLQNIIDELIQLGTRK